MSIGRVILVFIIWIPASEWKKIKYGKVINRRNKEIIKWDTNGDLLTKKALCYSFHFMKRCPYKSKNPECSWAKASGYSWSLLVLEFKDNKEFDGSPVVDALFFPIYLFSFNAFWASGPFVAGFEFGPRTYPIFVITYFIRVSWVILY